MMNDKNLISYSKTFCNRPLVSDGYIEVFDPDLIFVAQGNKINIIKIPSLEVTTFIEGDEHKVTAWGMEDQFLFTASENQMTRIWEWKTKTLKHIFKCGHKKPITHICFQKKQQNIITAASDVIKVYNLVKKYNIFDFKGFMGPLHFLSTIKSIPNLIITGCQDNNIRIWDTMSGSLKFTLTDHSSQVISVDQNENSIFTLGRDKTINIYRISDFKKYASILLFEDVECMRVIPSILINIKTDFSHLICTIGSSGILKFWKHSPSKCLFQTTINQLSNTGSKLLQRCLTRSINLFSNEKMAVFSTHLADLVFFSLDNLKIVKHSSLNLNQIFCLGFFENNIIVSFDSPSIRILESHSNNCLQVLEGHDDTVLCFDYYDGSLVTGGKDEKILYWELDENSKFVKLGQGLGHDGAITAISLSKKKTNKFIVSSSDDNTLKLWKFDSKKSEFSNLKLEWSEIAHKNTISCVKVSLKDKFIATGSYDKTIKIWSKNKELISQLTGHKRQITSCDFSKTDNILVSGSIDTTIRIWSLTDFTAIKVLEGSESSVCSVAFLNNGIHLIGGYSSGLIKIWLISEGNEIQSLEGHAEKVWTLSINENDDIVSGDSEGCITVWTNTTEITNSEKKAEFLELKEKEQELSNLLKNKEDEKSLRLAIEIKHSKTLYELLERNISTQNGLQVIKEVVTNLKSEDLDNLLEYIETWNKNTRYFSVAQIVLNIILTNSKNEDLMNLPHINQIIASMIPYSERHLNRVDKCLERAAILSFVEHCTINKT